MCSNLVNKLQQLNGSDAGYTNVSAGGVRDPGEALWKSSQQKTRAPIT
jgi:hypothetical protein